MPTASISPVDLAKRVAALLRIELTFTKPPTAHDKQLYDELPLRSALSFSTEGGISTAKASFAAEISDEDAMKHLFCMVHGEFVPSAGMDVDHTFAHSQIRERQEAFLTFLNTHHDFAHAFLKQPDMKNFFGRDKDRVFKGTGYFYKACYNEMDNLWLLCHACNVKKSDADPLAWFREQEPYFGKAFVDSVTKNGGLHGGILMDRVQQKIDGMKITIGERIINLPVSGRNSVGLGKFVRDWFFQHYKAHYEVHREFYTQNYAKLKINLLEIQALQEEGHTAQVQRALRRLRKGLEDLNNIQEAFHKYAIAMSTSAPTDPSLKEAVGSFSKNAFRYKETEHSYAKIRDIVTKHYSKDFADSVCPANRFEILKPEPCKAMWKRLKPLLNSSALPSQAKLHELFSTWYEENSPAAERARKAEEATQKEYQSRLAAEAQAKEDRKIAEEAQRVAQEAQKEKKEERKAKEKLYLVATISKR